MKKFYQALLLDAGPLKKKMGECDSFGEKFYYALALFFHASLIVVVAVLFVSLMNALFGSENSAMAIVIFIIILMIRYINFGYRLSDSLITLAAALLIMTFAPALALSLPPCLGFFVHFFALLAILLIMTQQPRMGFAGFFGFAYSYLVGNAVEGELLMQRAELAVVGYILCALILIYAHRRKNTDVHFLTLLRTFRFSNLTSLWQIRLAVGVAFVLTVGSALDIPRFMWFGFACSTLLARYPYSDDTQIRLGERIEGIAIGSVSFLIFFRLIPESFLSLVGLLSGVVLGFCDKYRWKTIVICFGALTTATELFGLETACLLRITNNVIGAVFAVVFALLYDRLIVAHLVSPVKAQG